MDYMDEIQDEIRRKNVAIEKSFDPFYIDPEVKAEFEKGGKRAGVGEIRIHGGRKVQKQGDGSWKPVKEEGDKNSEKDSEAKKKWMDNEILPEVDSMMRSSGMSRKDAISALKDLKPFKKS